jgi:hypothetical protein
VDSDDMEYTKDAAGKTDVSKDLLINSVIGFTTAGLANFSILGKISS